jgi:hypothetical protein
MKILSFIKKLFLPDASAETTASKPYYETQKKNLQAIWNNTAYKDFGIERILRLLLQLTAFIIPSGLLRSITGTSNFLFRRLSVEFLVIIKLTFLYFVLKLDCTSSFCILVIAIVLTADTLHFSISRIVLNDLYRKHVSFTRSLILKFINYIEVCLFFAILYSYLDHTNLDINNHTFIINDSLHAKDNHLTSIQAIYFSFVTAATIGYGDITPKDPFVMKMIVVQIIISLFFVVVFLSSIINRLGRTTFYNEKRGKDIH